MDLARLADKVIGGGRVERHEARALLALHPPAVFDLLHAANRVRVAVHGQRVDLCSIVAGKVGRCGEDCRFCAQSARHHTAIEPRDMISADQAAHAAQQAQRVGAACFSIVTSGRAPTASDWPKVIDAVRAVARVPGIRCSASLGFLTDAQIGELRQAGAVRLHHNIETSERFFPNVATTHTWQDRLATANRIRAAGIELCCGALFGVGESPDDRLDVAFALRDLQPHSVPLNFLAPVPGTPLEDAPPMAPLDILKTVAVFRLILPHAELKVAGGREVNLRDLQSWIFYAGATGMLIGNYLTTTGRPPEADLKMIDDLGLERASVPFGRDVQDSASRSERGVSDDREP